MFGKRIKSQIPESPHVKTLPKFSPGERVRVQNPKSKRWDREGIIKEIRPSNKSFLIEVDNKIILRNKRYLKRMNENFDGKESPNEPHESSKEPLMRRRSPRFLGHQR